MTVYFNSYHICNGTGQGACPSPAVWAMISSVLFEVHKETSHGAKVHRLYTKDKFSMIGFVDDTGNLMLAFEPLEILHFLATLDTQQWAELLYTSGGLLKLLMCHFYCTFFQLLSKKCPALDFS